MEKLHKEPPSIRDVEKEYVCAKHKHGKRKNNYFVITPYFGSIFGWMSKTEGLVDMFTINGRYEKHRSAEQALEKFQRDWPNTGKLYFIVSEEEFEKTYKRKIDVTGFYTKEVGEHSNGKPYFYWEMVQEKFIEAFKEFFPLDVLTEATSKVRKNNRNYCWGI